MFSTMGHIIFSYLSTVTGYHDTVWADIMSTTVVFSTVEVFK